MKKSELRKLIREEIKRNFGEPLPTLIDTIKAKQNLKNEGTWSLPKNKAEGMKYIKATEKFKDSIYQIFGDDMVFDGFDSAIKRMKELLKGI